MQGKIIKGIAGFYYVHTSGRAGIYECKAKGIFRKDNIRFRLEIYKHIWFGATPFVNSLVWVPHNEKIFMGTSYAIYQFPVVSVTVLHFVNLHIVQLILPIIFNVVEIFKNI